MKKTDPPKHLSAEARRLWDRLTTDYVLDDAGGMLLLRSALEAFDRLQDARKTLATDGAIVRDRWGQPKPHPALAIERDEKIGAEREKFPRDEEVEAVG